jgi:hypothetical protein
MPTRRNPVVRTGAILRKGGVHRQSASGHRHQGKRSLCDELDEWFADEQDTDDSTAVFGCEDEAGSVEHRAPRKRKGWGSTPRSFIVIGHNTDGSYQMLSGVNGA